MADAADIADAIQAEMVDIAVRAARNAILPGISGECDGCEWWMPRLVDGLCGFCRDGRPRPPDWEPPPRPDPVVVANPPVEIPIMPAKSIQLPASAETAIRLLETFAKEHGVSLGHAAAELIEVGSAPQPPAPAPSLAPWENPDATPRERMVELIDGIAGLVAGLIEQADDAGARVDQSAEIAAATARAEEAERIAESLREALAAEGARANAAFAKLDAMRDALAA